MNPGISYNVFGIDDRNKKDIIPLYSSEIEKSNHIDLLFTTSEDGQIWHYSLIKNMSSLIAHRSKHERRSFVCRNCLHAYSSKSRYLAHFEACKQHKPATIKMPTGAVKKDPTTWVETNEKPILKFMSKQKCHPVPFSIFYDFESF